VPELDHISTTEDAIWPTAGRKMYPCIALLLLHLGECNKKGFNHNVLYTTGNLLELSTLPLIVFDDLAAAIDGVNSKKSTR